MFLILVALSIDNNLRAKVSAAFELSMYFAAHGVLTAMYSPKFWGAKSFPFHAVVSEDIMKFDGKYNVKRGGRETFTVSRILVKNFVGIIILFCFLSLLDLLFKLNRTNLFIENTEQSPKR